MSDHEFTPDQIVDGITHAIREREFDVVPSLIKLLAVQDPRRAQAVLNSIEVGIELGRTFASRP